MTFPSLVRCLLNRSSSSSSLRSSLLKTLIPSLQTLISGVAMNPSEDPPASSAPFSASPNLNKSEVLEASPAAADPASGSEGSAAVSIDAMADVEHGFSRPEMNTLPLAGTVEMHERHVFLCYKTADSWPARVEAAESDRVPRLLAAALKNRKNEMPKKTRLTICEGRDGTETSNGDVWVFPDMIGYRGLTHFDVDAFVEDVLVKETEWVSGAPEALSGSYVFVCAHGSRDKKCGVCGPPLIKKFKEEIEASGLKSQITVTACSHIGGHKYAGNVIIFSPGIGGNVTGHWYGYVTPEHVPVLLNQHIVKGEIVDRLWRGQMGLSEEEQKRLLEERLKANTVVPNGVDTNKEEGGEPPSETNDSTEVSQNESGGCCGSGTGKGAGFVCCQDVGDIEDRGAADKNKTKSAEGNPTPVSKKAANVRKKGWSCDLPKWFETWEKEDTFATLAVVGAVASLAVAYAFYHRSRSA